MSTVRRRRAPAATFFTWSTSFPSRGGSDAESNRALACASCNLAKADRVSGRDPLTGNEAPLFHPRVDLWQEHFRWSEDRRTLTGRTATGRATIAALDLNSELRQTARRLWFAAGLLPPYRRGAKGE